MKSLIAPVSNLLIAVYILVLSGCVSIEPVTVTGINNVTVESISLVPKINFDVVVHNPNSVGLTLQAFKSSAFLDDKLITEIYSEKVMRIPPQSDISIPMNAQPSLQDILNTVLSGSLKGTLRVDGFVTVKKFLFKKKFPFTVSNKF